MGVRLSDRTHCSSRAWPPRMAKTPEKIAEPTNNQQTMEVVLAVRKTASLVRFQLRERAWKANKKAPIAFGVLFATMFSVLYESWLTGSLNPFSILLVTIMTMMTEDEIVEWEANLPEEEVGEGDEDETQVVVPQWAARN